MESRTLSPTSLPLPAPRACTTTARPAPHAVSTVTTVNTTTTVKRVEDWLTHNRAYALETARRITGNRDEAEDAVGEAALRAIRSASTYDPKQSMSRWFCHIVRMVCYEWIRTRKAKKRPKTLCFTSAAAFVASDAGEAGGSEWYFDVADGRVDVEAEAIENVLGVADLPDWILEGLSALCPVQRALLLDVHVLQVPRQEVMEREGWSEYQFGKQLKAAQVKLREACGL